MTALWARPAFSPRIFPFQSFSPKLGTFSVGTRVYTIPIHRQNYLQSNANNSGDTSINDNNKTGSSLSQEKKNHQDKKTIMASHMPRLKIAWTFVYDFKAGISHVWNILHTTNHIKLPLIWSLASASSQPATSWSLRNRSAQVTNSTEHSISACYVAAANWLLLFACIHSKPQLPSVTPLMWKMNFKVK